MTETTVRRTASGRTTGRRVASGPMIATTVRRAASGPMTVQTVQSMAVIRAQSEATVATRAATALTRAATAVGGRTVVASRTAAPQIVAASTEVTVRTHMSTRSRPTGQVRDPHGSVRKPPSHGSPTIAGSHRTAAPRGRRGRLATTDSAMTVVLTPARAEASSALSTATPPTMGTTKMVGRTR